MTEIPVRESDDAISDTPQKIVVLLMVLARFHRFPHRLQHRGQNYRPPQADINRRHASPGAPGLSGSPDGCWVIG